MTVDRRTFIRALFISAGLLTVSQRELLAQSLCTVMHPLMPAQKEFAGSCDNCGMPRSMWARTWHTFTQEGKKLEVCSMHCLAESSLNSGTPPEEIEVSLYHSPEMSIPAAQAFYVIGSNARGTMSMKSKIALGSKSEADKFAGMCGGETASFKEAYSAAAQSIAEENVMINRSRISKGKIVEPRDNTDICPVCGMYSARYPKNKCQIQTKNDKVLHFCATQCLFEFIANPAKYQHPGIQQKIIWVVDYGSGQWIYGKSAFYVVGSNIKGPMGKEAFPFASRDSAKRFVDANSGKILRYHETNMDKILL